MKIEVFFDYACPYCFIGHQNLMEELAQYPQMQVDWNPCEAHPKPEQRSIHSDIAIQGMYLIEKFGGNLEQYHLLIYKALFELHQDISDKNLLSEYGQQCGAEKDAFEQALIDNWYAQKVLDGNIYAWRTCQLNAVPSYRFGNLFLGSRDGILASRQELKRFLANVYGSKHKN